MRSRLRTPQNNQRTGAAFPDHYDYGSNAAPGQRASERPGHIYGISAVCFHGSVGVSSNVAFGGNSLGIGHIEMASRWSESAHAVSTLINKLIDSHTACMRMAAHPYASACVSAVNMRLLTHYHIHRMSIDHAYVFDRT